MPTAKRTPRRTSKSKSRTTSRKTTSKRTTAHRRTSPKRTPGGERLEAATFVYECTRPDCGYRIVRDEKMEQGQTRSDLKCPKCHNQEFRCLGKGDLPETFTEPVTAVQPDFQAFDSVALGSN